MSNRRYRTAEPLDLEASRQAEIEEGAHELVFRILSEGGAPAERLRAMLSAEFERQGGHQIDLQMEALILVIEEARLDRALDIKHKQALLDAKGDEAPQQARRRVVSAATLCNASRQLTALRAERNELQRRCEVVVATAIMLKGQEREHKERGEPNFAEAKSGQGAKPVAEAVFATGVKGATADVA
ncbi:MAG: hypothetical protein HPKKFMNG_01683 [Planctomycetes bacterium]|nr:hypothetical protein [Planctomycetota bacterium]